MANLGTGSRNALGIGYLLAQQKAEMGNMRVKTIHGFKADRHPSDS